MIQVASLKTRFPDNGLASRYIEMLEVIRKRKEVVLPVGLKRDKSEQYLDEENFEKLSKKIKID